MDWYQMTPGSALRFEYLVGSGFRSHCSRAIGYSLQRSSKYGVRS